ncbi:uncharacterized protein LOC115632346 [Scaptodrosophila lebanonensis]|uniref:Uncharacterized protein LOC115632346 n=1 Tax=Drosophila lebanonensis TaxID=7225 RepID=A0A6J2UDW9_DROLE|nr:uncharacterized protein LOC115632346 [Scaptodrosophila lebanonensis]
MSPPQSPTKRPWFRFTFPPLRPIFSQNTAVLTPAFTKVDDMLIQRTRSFWRCDKILCPVATTEYCQTMKVTSQKKKNYYERRNTCFGKNKKVLLSKSVLEKGRPYEQIHIIAELHRNGISNTQNVRNIKY